MAVQIILILITLASAVVGTILTGHRLKTLVIILACATSGATLLTSYSDYQDKEFIKSALEAQLASGKPTPEFSRALGKSVKEVAQKYGLEWEGTTSQDSQTVYFFSNAGGTSRSGALTLSMDQLGAIFVKFISRKSLNAIVEKAMFSVPVVSNEAETDKVLDGLVIMAHMAIDEMPWVKPETTYRDTTNWINQELQVTAEDGSNKAEVGLSQELFTKLVVLYPVERNWQAFLEFQRQLQRVSATEPSHILSK
jgi:hypothetical protein